MDASFAINPSFIWILSRLLLIASCSQSQIITSITIIIRDDDVQQPSGSYGYHLRHRRVVSFRASIQFHAQPIHLTQLPSVSAAPFNGLVTVFKMSIVLLLRDLSMSKCPFLSLQSQCPIAAIPFIGPLKYTSTYTTSRPQGSVDSHPCCPSCHWGFIELICSFQSLTGRNYKTGMMAVTNKSFFLINWFRKLKLVLSMWTSMDHWQHFLFLMRVDWTGLVARNINFRFIQIQSSHSSSGGFCYHCYNVASATDTRRANQSPVYGPNNNWKLN